MTVWASGESPPTSSAGSTTRTRWELVRPMKDNSIWRAVREGRAALGTGLKEFASRGVPWIIEASGFDYCMIDHEHGAFDLETIADLAGWFQATDVSAIVQGRRAPDSGGLQCARQTCPRVGGDRGADRGVLAAWLQGVEPARQRRQHLA